MLQLPVSLSKLSLISLVTSYTSIIALPPYFLIIATTLAAHSTHTTTTFNALSTSMLYLLICRLFEEDCNMYCSFVIHSIIRIAVFVNTFLKIFYFILYFIFSYVILNLAKHAAYNRVIV